MLPPSLPPRLAEALTARGYTDLTAVQVAVGAPEAEGRDLLVSSRTGSGKTVAYGLAMAGELLGENGALPAPGKPLALVVAPTRELALQVQRELEWLYTGARVASCVGGMDPRREQRALAAGSHIVVGTPGRLRDHLERGNLDLSDLRVAVLDEADEMLDLGFREELEAILDTSPEGRRTLLFSATLPRPIIALARRYQREALNLTVGERGERGGHADIDYLALAIAPSDIEHATVNLLRYFEPGSALVFCSTREAVRRLHANLVERGFSAVALSGELTQNERANALQALRDRRARVCVATDVAARGIDIPDLELVIHAELPHDAQGLQHRSGRTGRAGRKGTSAILVPYPRRRRAEGMLRTAGVQVTWRAAPSADDIRAKDQERLIAELGRPADDLTEDDIAVARVLLSGENPEVVVATLVRAQRAALPAPEDLVETGPAAPSHGPSSYAPETSGPRDAKPRPGFEDTAWYTIDLGRNRNAEARWLLPLICRRGHITKAEIGAIRIFDRETRFEIVRKVVARFDEALAAGGDDDGGRIAPLADPEAPVKRDRGAPKKGPPRRAESSAKPYRKGPKPAGDAPHAKAYAPRLDSAPAADRPVRKPGKFNSPKPNKPL